MNEALAKRTAVPQSKPVNTYLQKDLTQKEAIRELKEIAAAIGHTPNYAYCVEKHPRIIKTINKHFSGWDEALEFAGLTPAPISKTYWKHNGLPIATQKAILMKQIEQYRAIYGEYPTRRELVKLATNSDEWPSICTAQKILGTETFKQFTAANRAARNKREETKLAETCADITQKGYVTLAHLQESFNNNQIKKIVEKTSITPIKKFKYADKLAVAINKEFPIIEKDGRGRMFAQMVAEGQTQEAIAQNYNITRERVRQIVNRYLARVIGEPEPAKYINIEEMAEILYEFYLKYGENVLKIKGYQQLRNEPNWTYLMCQTGHWKEIVKIVRARIQNNQISN